MHCFGEISALSIQLLRDLQMLFARADGKNLSSEEIAYDLGRMEDRPWPDYNRGQAITTRGIAKLLKPFKIAPRQVIVREHQVQGYRWEQFKWAFKRYVGEATDK